MSTLSVFIASLQIQGPQALCCEVYQQLQMDHAGINREWHHWGWWWGESFLCSLTEIEYTEIHWIKSLMKTTCCHLYFLKKLQSIYLKYIHTYVFSKNSSRIPIMAVLAVLVLVAELLWFFLFSASFSKSKSKEDEAEIFPNDKTLFHSFKIKSRDFVHKTLKMVFQYHFIYSQFAHFQKRSFRLPTFQWFVVIDSDCPWPYHLFYTFWALWNHGGFKKSNCFDRAISKNPYGLQQWLFTP